MGYGFHLSETAGQLYWISRQENYPWLKSLSSRPALVVPRGDDLGPRRRVPSPQACDHGAPGGSGTAVDLDPHFCVTLLKTHFLCSPG